MSVLCACIRARRAAAAPCSSLSHHLGASCCECSSSKCRCGFALHQYIHRLRLCMDEIRPHHKEQHPAFVQNRMTITLTLYQLHAPDRSQSAMFLGFRTKTLRHEAYTSATMKTTGAATQNRTIVSTMHCVFDSCGNTDCSAETAIRAALLTLLLSHSPP